MSFPLYPYVKRRLEKSTNPFVRSALKHAPRYFGLPVVGSAVGLVMMKYYTHAFHPEQFGVLSLYLMIFQYAQTLFGLGYDASSPRVYFDYKGKDRQEFLGTVIIFMACTTAFWFLVSLSCEKVVVAHLGGSFSLFVVSLIMGSIFVFSNFLTRISYNEHYSGLVFGTGMAQLATNHATSVFLIAIARLGILGRQIGLLAGHLMSLLFSIKYLRKAGLLRVRWTFRPDIFRRINHFALPSIVSTILGVALGYVDRIFLNHFHGPRQVGIYAVAFSISQVMSFALEAISMSLFPSIMKELEADYDMNIRRLRRVDVHMGLSLLSLGACAIFFKDIMVLVVSNADYAVAGNVIPFMVFANVMCGFYKSASGVLSYHGVVWIYPALTVVAFGISAFVSFLIIPRFNEVGAAYGDFIGGFLYSLLVQLCASKYYFSWKKIVPVYSVIFAGVTLLFAHYIHYWTWI